MTDYGHDLLFGGFVTPTSQQPQLPVTLAQVCERAGLDLVTFQDHPYQPAFLDTWTLLSFAAARTSTIRLSANVLSLPLRGPAIIARSAASLDLLSGGRLELGLGAGAFWDAIEAMGGRRLRPGQAVQALGEAIDIIRGVWQAGEQGMLRVDGDFYRVHGAKRGPAPAHDIGIWLGGPGEWLSPVRPWDEATRPAAPEPPPDAAYTSRGRAISRHLIAVHDHLRAELGQIRDLIDQVRSGAVGAGQARSVINELAIRQNDWTLGAYCASYCRIVTGHHTLEDEAVFPYLRDRDPGLGPVIDRLTGEHKIIHEVLNDVDRALVDLLQHPGDFSGLQGAADVLTDAMLSHLAYEEAQLIEPLARHGFYSGQL